MNMKQSKLNIIYVTRNKEKHSINLKGSIPQKDITIVNVHALKNRDPKYLKQQLTELKGEMDN